MCCPQAVTWKPPILDRSAPCVNYTLNPLVLSSLEFRFKKFLRLPAAGFLAEERGSSRTSKRICERRCPHHVVIFTADSAAMRKHSFARRWRTATISTPIARKPAPTHAAIPAPAPTPAATAAAAALVSFLADDDLVGAARARAAFLAAHSHLDAHTAHTALALLLVHQHARQPIDFRRAADAGVVFNGDCLQAAIICTRPRDFDVLCPRAQAYVSPRIAAYMQCVRALLDLGAHRGDVPAEDPPLVTAVNTTWVNLELLALLLAAGCDPDCTGPTGMTPLMMVALNASITPRQRAAAAGRLAEARADVCARSENGNTALHHAVLAQNTDMFRVLADMGAAMDAQGHSKLTPLMLAVVRGHSGCLRKLVEAGADVHFKHVDTEPRQVYADAISLAITRNDFVSLRLLLDLGAKVNDIFVNGRPIDEREAISGEMQQFLAERVALQQRAARANAVARQLGIEDEVDAGRGALGGGEGDIEGGVSAKRSRRRRKKQERELERLLAETAAAASEAAAVAAASEVSAAARGEQVPVDVAMEEVADVREHAPGAQQATNEVEPPSAAARVWGNKPRAVMQAGAAAVVTPRPTPPAAFERGVATFEFGMGRLDVQAAVDHSPDLPPSEECVICMGARRTTAMDPCGHYCVCDGCAASCLAAGGERNCPLCRGFVEKTLRIYL